MLGTKMITLGFALVICLTMTHTCLAQSSPQDYVNAHNKARRTVGVGPVTWDNTLQTYAQNYANKRKGDCKQIGPGGSYGENIFWGRPGKPDYTAADAVDSWMSEKQYYNYQANTCARGRKCDHYTQVVWRKSTRIGCGKVKCNNNAGYFIMCCYDPRGNTGGRPYEDIQLNSEA